MKYSITFTEPGSWGYGTAIVYAESLEEIPKAIADYYDDNDHEIEIWKRSDPDNWDSEWELDEEASIYEFSRIYIDETKSVEFDKEDMAVKIGIEVDKNRKENDKRRAEQKEQAELRELERLKKKHEKKNS
jgi:hypothetical protein